MLFHESTRNLDILLLFRHGDAAFMELFATLDAEDLLKVSSEHKQVLVPGRADANQSAWEKSF
jgi:hypothetical protein